MKNAIIAYQRKMLHSELYSQIIDAGNDADNLTTFAERILNLIIKSINLDRASLYIIQDNPQFATLLHTAKRSEKLSIVKDAIDLSESPYYLTVTEARPTFTAHDEGATRGQRVIGSRANIPLLSNGQVIGILLTDCVSGKCFTNPDTIFFNTLGKLIGMVVSKISAERKAHRLNKYQQENQMFEEILSASADHIYMFDKDRRYIYVNKTGAIALGHDIAEILGKTGCDLGIESETMDKFFAQTERVYSSGQQIVDEILWPALDGLREYEYVLTPAYKADGLVDAVVAIVRDVSVRKKIERELQESRSELARRVEDRTVALSQTCNKLKEEIQEREESQKITVAHVKKLEALNQLIGLGNALDDLTLFAERVLELTLQMINFESGCIHLVDQSTRTLDLLCAKGLSFDVLEQVNRKKKCSTYRFGR